MTRMRAEIAEQPEAIRNTIDALLPAAPDIADLAKPTSQVLFIARGSSDNAAVYGRYLMEVHCGRVGILASPSVATAYKVRLDLRGVLAVALSQSGQTREIVDTLAWARKCGARSVAITNDARSPLAETADLALVTRAGIERAVPATKTYTTQLTALCTLALGVGPMDAALREGLRRVPDQARWLLDASTEGAAAIADQLAGVDGLVVSGRGFTYSTALEIALKLKEACYLSAIGLSYGDLVHGPIAVVDQTRPVILVAPATGPVLPNLIDLADQIVAGGAGAYGIGGGDALASRCAGWLPGPEGSEALAPITLAIPGQLLAEELARRRGVDPDAPRRLGGDLGKITQT